MKTRLLVLMLPAAAAAVLLAAVGAEDAGKSAAPLAGPYMLAPAPDGVTVCWTTEEACVGSVRWRAAGAADRQEAREAAAAEHHAVRVSGLSPGAEHELEAFSGAASAGTLACRTPPKPGAEPPEPMTFYVYGDTRSNPAAHEKVAAALLAEAERLKQHTFVVHVGDFAQRGSDEKEWGRQFFRPAAAMLRRLPLLPVRGNHEGDAGLHRQFFPEPRPPEKLAGSCEYSLDFGPARLLVLDEYAVEGREARLKWIAETLAAPGARWRFATFHEPLYATGDHGSSLGYRRYVGPAFSSGKIHAVFAGHDHDYERSRVLDGITHFVVGGGGAPLGGQTEPVPEWSARFVRTHCFLTVTLTADRMSIRALRPAGKAGAAAEEFDSVEIPLDCRWPAAGKPEPAPAPAPAP